TNDYGSNETVKAGEITQVKNVYESVFTPADVPLIYVLGNHDHDFQRNGGAGSSLQTFEKVMGNIEAYTQYDVAVSDAANGSRHVVINGYHFLMVEPITYSCSGADASGAKYREETKKWLDDTLAEITSANPNQYVFVLTHPMIYNTVYGSDLLTSGIYWYTKDLTSTLEKYPQVVTFGGHLHFPLNDERSIMQNTFTSLGCGSAQYMAIEDGGYEDMKSATVMNDANSISSGYLVQIDGDGNVRFIRIDFSNEQSIKEPFVISAPNAAGTHLTKYTAERGSEANNKAPVFANDVIAIEDNSDTDDELLYVTIKFKAATDDDLVHHYVVSVKAEGGSPTTYKILADFYRHPKVEDMKKEYTLDLGTNFTRGTKYIIELTAYDSWGAASNTVVYNYEPKIDLENVKIPTPYADIDFDGGKITDKNGKLTIENVGATVGDTEVSFNGIKKTLPALNIKESGQYALVTFSEFTTSTSFASMFKNDFAIEVLYVNRSKSGTQSIIGGFDKYGMSLYEENGAPAFKMHMKGAFQTITTNKA
ncbi:MAG: metallophosphoesterase family protein, partial [Eubacteriales bacterium]